MSINFEFIDDPDKYPFSLEVSAEGVQIVRTGRINTDDPIRAFSEATGLPAIGDICDTRFPSCVCSRIGPIARIGGRDTSGEGAGGWMKVPVLYRTPGYAGSVIIKQPTSVADKWSEISTSPASVTVYADWNDDGTGGFPPIAGGDGTTKQISTIEAKVRTFFPLEGPVPWARLIQLATENGVNESVTNLPGPFGTAARITMGIGQVRYTGFECDRQNDFLAVTHLLSLAEQHLYRGVLTDKDGNVVASEQRWIYKPLSMQGLWD